VVAKRQPLIEQGWIDLEHRLPCGCDGALDHALQLAHDPGPAVLAQPLHRLRGDRLDDGANPARVPAEEEERAA
jgi:hypothetical protein